MKKKTIINHVAITVVFLSVISASNAGPIAESYTPYIHGGNILTITPFWQTFESQVSGTLENINLKLWREGDQELNSLTISMYKLHSNWYSLLGTTSINAESVGISKFNAADVLSIDFSNQNIPLDKDDAYFFTINTTQQQVSSEGNYIALGVMIENWVVEGDPTKQMYDNGGLVFGHVNEFHNVMFPGMQSWEDMWFEVTLVPEPCSLILLGLGSLLLRRKMN